jgi:hypothetical protein
MTESTCVNGADASPLATPASKAAPTPSAEPPTTPDHTKPSAAEPPKTPSAEAAPTPATDASPTRVRTKVWVICARIPPVHLENESRTLLQEELPLKARHRSTLVGLWSRKAAKPPVDAAPKPHPQLAAVAPSVCDLTITARSNARYAQREANELRAGNAGKEEQARNLAKIAALGTTIAIWTAARAEARRPRLERIRYDVKPSATSEQSRELERSRRGERDARIEAHKERQRTQQEAAKVRAGVHAVPC